MQGKGRRKFLRQVGGGLVAAGAVANGGLAIGAEEEAENRGPAPSPPAARMANSPRLRQTAAEVQRQRPHAITTTNGDEALYPNLIGTYGKGFPHAQSGEVNAADYQTMTHAISTQQHSDFSNIVLPVRAKSWSTSKRPSPTIWKAETRTLSQSPSRLAFSSAQAAADMVELYWQSLARDVPFAQWSTSPVIQNAATELGALSAYSGLASARQPRFGGPVYFGGPRRAVSLAPTSPNTCCKPSTSVPRRGNSCTGQAWPGPIT